MKKPLAWGCYCCMPHAGAATSVTYGAWVVLAHDYWCPGAAFLA
ncbi:hypothetical protein [Janthinobacterium sp. DSP2-3-3]